MIEVAVEYLKNNAPKLYEGERDAGLIKIANRVMDFGVSPDRAGELIMDHWLPHNPAHVPAEDIREKVRNAHRYGHEPIGCRPARMPAEECFTPELMDDWRPKGDGEQAGVAAGTPATRVTFRRASDITPESISWLWEGWLARGKYHVLAGVPGTGKTTIALSFAAIISSGGKWPDGTQATAGDVLIWTSEDSPADTLVPRLIRMGADLTRIHFLENFNLTDGKIRPFNPATDMRELAKTAKAIGDVALMILDPAVAVMPMSRNSHNDAETRNGMQPVVDFATASNTALLGIGHLAKGTAGKDPLERLNGSGAFGAIARMVMGAAKNKAVGEGNSERIFVRIKSNNFKEGDGFGYCIEARPLQEQSNIVATRIIWEESLKGEAGELLADAESGGCKIPKSEEAEQFLMTFLKDGGKPQKEIEAAAKAIGIAGITLRRAAAFLVEKIKVGEAGWNWKLPQWN